MSRPSRRAALFLMAWLGLAAAALYSGAVARAPAQALPLTVVALTAVALLALLGSRDGRRWAQSVSLPGLAAFHAWRIVPGIAFLALLARGALPRDFAVPAGVGDIAVGLAGLAVLQFAPQARHFLRSLLVAFNLLGLMDLASAVGTAYRLVLVAPSSMHLLRVLPLGLLPLFAVPLTLAAHLVALRRLAR